MNDIQRQLFKMQDIEYKKFHGKLMPTVNDEKIIGIRIPVLGNLQMSLQSQKRQKNLF